jgi:hypothetical protein
MTFERRKNFSFSSLKIFSLLSVLTKNPFFYFQIFIEGYCVFCVQREKHDLLLCCCVQVKDSQRSDNKSTERERAIESKLSVCLSLCSFVCMFLSFFLSFFLCFFGFARLSI